MSENENVEVAEATEPKAKKKVIGVTSDSILTVLTDGNPKRAGSASFDRFEGYLTDPNPTTVDEAIENGLTMGDIHYDIIHGYIEVEGAEIEEYMPTPREPKEDTLDEGDTLDEEDTGEEESDEDF